MITSFDEVAADLPTEILGLCQAYIDQIALFDERIGALDHEIKGRAKTDEATSRLMTTPGVGPMCATTIQAFAPPMEEFSNGVNLQPGAVLYQGRSQLVGDKSWLEPQKWDSAIYSDC